MKFTCAVTLEFEYDVDPVDYGTDDISEMIKIDENGWREHTALCLAFITDDISNGKDIAVSTKITRVQE